MWYKILESGKFIVIHRKGNYCGALFFLNSDGKIKSFNHAIGEGEPMCQTVTAFDEHINNMLAENFDLSILKSCADAGKLI